MRVVLSLNQMLDTYKIPDFRTHPQREYVKAVKTGEIPLQEGLEFLKKESELLVTRFDKEITDLPGNGNWIDFVNNFFVILYV